MDTDLRSDAIAILDGAPGYVVLPAGHGKTHLLAASCAVASERQKRVLVLTHTHAGVASIREKLRLLNVGAGIRVSTIDSWLKTLVVAFPHLSGGAQIVNADGSHDWDAIRAGSHGVMASPHIREMLSLSYDFALVDEFQDCSKPQHGAILAMRDVVSIAVFGDPMQAIFDFDESDRVDWETDLEGFNEVSIGLKPWRWVGKNEKLGADLLAIRKAIEDGARIDLAGLDINWLSSDDNKPLDPCWKLLGSPSDESVVILRKWAPECLDTAKRLKGKFGVMEEIEGKVLLKASRVIDASPGPKAAGAAGSFARVCFSKLPQSFKAKIDAMTAGTYPTFQSGKSLSQVLVALEAFSDSGKPIDLLTSFEEIEKLGGTRVCKEAWSEMKRSIRAWESGEYQSLTESVRAVRTQTSAMRRATPARSVSRAILVKGLQFDHCVVYQPDLTKLSAKELYVALTRPTRSLTVISEKSTLDFSATP